MEFSFKQVKSLLDIIQPFLIKGGASKQSCSMPTGVIEDIKPQKYIDAFDCLDRLMQTEEWADVQRIWGYAPPSTWEAYDLHGFTDMEEQRLLNAACRKLVEVWRQTKPPSFFGKHIHEVTPTDEATHEECPEGRCVQPEGAGTSEADC